MAAPLHAWWIAHQSDVIAALNSELVIAIAGSLIGAFAGAYGAQRIAERAKYRDHQIPFAVHSKSMPS